MADDTATHLPLKPVDFEVLLALAGGERHGYGLVQAIEAHTSGLMSSGASAAMVSQVPIGPGEPLSVVIPRLRNVPLDFQPGTRWAYSPQYGFDVLARVVEVASGMPFDRFAKQRIFDPLGMKDTFFYPATGNVRMASLYQSVDGQLRKQADGAWVNEKNPAEMQGNKTLVTSFSMLAIESILE